MFPFPTEASQQFISGTSTGMPTLTGMSPWYLCVCQCLLVSAPDENKMGVCSPLIRAAWILSSPMLRRALFAATDGGQSPTFPSLPFGRTFIILPNEQLCYNTDQHRQNNELLNLGLHLPLHLLLRYLWSSGQLVNKLITYLKTRNHRKLSVSPRACMDIILVHCSACRDAAG